MKQAPITYGQVYRKLRSLGFIEEPIEDNGYRHRLFRYPTIEAAQLTLPEEDPDRPLPLMYRGGA
jgi:hypothetical protein